ncbi:MAG: hypothetical protein H5U07_00490 [Candidatus Aminicenantes bacterium]|nr:hypothetical protein [Candidatus Aminicenantes bacterium]
MDKKVSKTKKRQAKEKNSRSFSLWTRINYYLSLFFIITFVTTFAPPEISAQIFSDRPGYLNLSFWTRNFVYSSVSPYFANEYENILHLDFYQNTFNYGIFTGLVDGALSGEGITAGHWFFGWQNFSLGAGKIGLRLGDNSFQFSNLGFRFSNYFPTYNYLRGFSFDYSCPEGGFIFFAGRVARLTGLFGSRYDITPQIAWGLMGRVFSSERFFMGFGFIHSENERTWNGQLITPVNHLLLLELEYKISSALKMVSEIQLNASGNEDDSARLPGSSVRVGSLLERGRLSLELNYRRVTGDFRSLSNEFFFGRDQEGLYASWRYQTKKRFYLFGAADYFHDNVERRPELRTTDYFRINTGFTLFSPAWPDLTLRFDLSGARSRTEDYRYQISPGFYLQLAKRFSRFYPYLRVYYQKFDDRLQNQNDFTYPSFYLGLTYHRGHGSYLLAEAVTARRFDYLQNRTLTQNRFRLAGYSPFLWSADFYGELDYTNYLMEYPYSSESKRVELLLGVGKQLPWQMKVRLDLRASWPIQSSLPANYWLTLKVDKRFNWGQAPVFQGRAAGLEISGTGRLEGLIFSDQNLNGLCDPGEKPMSGVEVRLEDGSLAVSNEQGKFTFPRVVEGLHTLEIDLRHIPAEFYLLTPERKTVVVAKRRVYQINIALVEGANVRGIVFLDANKNGIFDQGDQFLKDVLVFLKPVSLDVNHVSVDLTGKWQPEEINTYTDEMGEFRFDNIFPGKYELSVDEQTIPSRLKLFTSLPLKLEVKPGQEIKNLTVICHSRPVIYTSVVR